MLLDKNELLEKQLFGVAKGRRGCSSDWVSGWIG